MPVAECPFPHGSYPKPARRGPGSLRAAVRVDGGRGPPRLVERPGLDARLARHAARRLPCDRRKELWGVLKGRALVKVRCVGFRRKVYWLPSKRPRPFARPLCLHFKNLRTASSSAKEQAQKASAMH